ncbi:50S ribosomal protein L44e [Candidatus Woesearchaeota archaeon]|nr:50S ribosomal protein L44e [Candidatus Woesearchaeota archaeon]
MKLPKLTKRLCPYCRKHTEHKITQAKRRTPNTTKPMSYGSKKRARRRGLARGFGSLGRYSKKAISAFKMTGKKITKKTDLRYECKECKKMHTQKKGFRSKKIEFE